MTETSTPRTDALRLKLEGAMSAETNDALEHAEILERELTVCLARNSEFQADVIRIAADLNRAKALLERCDELDKPDNLYQDIQQFLNEPICVVSQDVAQEALDKPLNSP